MFHTKSQFVFLLSLVLLAACNAPTPIASADWCLTQPCLELFGITINKPSSSILVYVLALYSLYVGYKFYRNRGTHQSKKYWGLSLILGGIGAFSAGTSFQAFGYEIKCAGKTFCDNTSFFEIAYNVLSVWSAALLLLAISASFLHKSSLKLMQIFGFFFSAVYSILCVNAYLHQEYLFVSFEFLLLYISPIYLYIFILTAYQFAKAKNIDLKKYMSAWLILMLTIIGYYIYLSQGITELFWNKGLWFSANDVLHLGMIAWLFYLSNYLMEEVKDSE